jgi:hypothetical protein
MSNKKPIIAWGIKVKSKTGPITAMIFEYKDMAENYLERMPNAPYYQVCMVQIKEYKGKVPKNHLKRELAILDIEDTIKRTKEWDGNI